MPKTGKKLLVALCLALISPAGVISAEQDRTIIVQSTTSTQNSGLYDVLLPAFENDTGIRVHVVAVGTGQALNNARNGDGDLVLVHARRAEQTFVAEGYGVERFDLMHNDFVIVGPIENPAEITRTDRVTDALNKIAARKSLFASRGDDSGTHQRERLLWARAGTNPQDNSGDWYRETGSGMGATLNTAIGMAAYTLTDRASWIRFANKDGYAILNEGDPALINRYGVILVNPQRHPHVRQESAQRFIDWLLSAKGQRIIGAYRVNGQQLFFPNPPPRDQLFHPCH